MTGAKVEASRGDGQRLRAVQKKAGTQVIVYPAELASGKLQLPYSEGR
jgi:hypothetical protein